MRSDQNSNSSMLLGMSWLPTRMKKIKSKLNELEWSNIVELLLDTQGQITIVAGLVWPKIKLIKAFLVALDTCKNDEDPSRN